jgi:glycosyltransferase involved in cell wall biosynthesis
MTATTPTVSVLMSVYNGADYLQEAIDSILNQTFRDFEFLIINDGSTDRSRNIICSYKDPRIRLVDNEKNIGLIDSLNKGLSLAQGKFIARQDADDISLPNRLEDQINVFKERPDCILVSSNMSAINSDGSFRQFINRDCDSSLVPWHLTFNNRIAGHSQVTFKRETALDVGGYSRDRIYAEDYDLWVRLAKTGGEMIILPKVHLKRRIHKESISRKRQEIQDDTTIAIIKDRIKEILGREVSNFDAKALQGFWLGSFGHQIFPSPKQADKIYSLLIEIAKKYSELTNGRPDSLSLTQLNQLIGDQFLLWLRSPLTSRHGLGAKVTIARYAFALNPLGTVQSLLIWLLRLPLDTTISVKNKISPRLAS